MTTSEEIAEEICRVITKEAYTWSFDNYTYASSVMFYQAALRLMKRRPLEDDEINRTVIDFLERKLDEATEKMLEDSVKHIEGVVARHLGD